MEIVRRPGLFRLWRLIRESDVLFIAGPAVAPMLLALLARRPFVVEHHGYQAVCPNGLLLNKLRGGVCGEAFRLRQYGECLGCVRKDFGTVRAPIQLALTFVRHRLCRFASANVAVTQHVQKRHFDIPSQVIYHGIPSYKGEQESGTALFPGTAVHFAYVGRLVGEKGLPLLLRAAAAARAKGLQFELSFIGDGPLRQELESLATELNLHPVVRFTGFLVGEILRREVQRVDVVVMPSVWEETAGLAAMEQMMRGKAVLAAKIGGLGEVVGNGGVCFRPMDVDDLAARMIELGDHDVRRHVGLSASARARQMFQVDRMVHEHEVLLREVCHDRQSR
jgi:glycosyltransferase involved in cell wall biosynthesis